MSDNEIEVYEARPPVSPSTLFGSDDPSEVIERATAHAKALDGVIRGRGLFAKIGDKDHVKVEGWTLLGSMVGVFPIVVWTRKMESPEGWEARVEARTRAGEIVGAAEAQCTREENMWSHSPVGRNGQKLSPRDDYALRSMAQTRATSKALRAPLGFIVELAGYQATPAEEMPVIDARPADDGQAPTKAQHAKLAVLIKETDADPEKYPLEGDYMNWTDWSRSYIVREFGKQSRSQLTRKEMTKLIDDFEKARIPFG